MKTLLKYYTITVLVLLFAACSSSEKEKNTEVINNTNEDVVNMSLPQFESSNAELIAIENQLFTVVINTNGLIDVPPANKAKVSALASGYIYKSPLLVGDKVKKGQLLFTLKNNEYIKLQQEYLETLSKLSYLKSDYERQKIMLSENITSKKKFLEAESIYKSTQAINNGLEQQLRLLNVSVKNAKNGKFTSIIPIYAPITGTISKVNASVGKYVEVSDVVLEIINNNKKHLELVVFEKDVLNLEKGQEIKFKLPENSNKIYKAEVDLIGSAIDEINRTAKVHAHLTEENNPFLVGMYVEAEIITNTKTKKALPVESILEEDGKSVVMVLKNKTNNKIVFEKVTVQLGLQNEDFVEIINFETLENKQILNKGSFI